MNKSILPKKNLNRGLSLSHKGFLFTVSAILFASTLIFYSMSFTSINSSSEYLVSYSARHNGALYLGDNIAFDLSKVFGLTIDLNKSVNQVLISGEFSSAHNQLSELNSYESFLNNAFFPLTPGDDVLDLNNLKDGAVEVYFGSALQGDYNYDNYSFALFPLSSEQLSNVDLNIRASGDLNGLDWNVASGPVVITINYTDDSNTFSTIKSVALGSVSSLTLIYLDSNSVLSFGNAYHANNNSILITASPTHKMSYVLSAKYSTVQSLFPVRFNSSFSTVLSDYNIVSDLSLIK